MSINHILLDSVEDTEKLDVKFGIVEADNIDIDNLTITDLTINGQFIQNQPGTAIMTDIQANNIVTNQTVLVGNNLVVQNLIRTENGFVQTNAVLFKSLPFLNSTTIGIDELLFPNAVVDGMLIFDDVGKVNFAYRMPYKIDFDNYLGLTGAQTYAFRFSVAIFANMPSNSVLKLSADPDPNSGIFFNYPGTLEKVLSHTLGAEDSYNFVCVRQTDGTYIIYG